MRSGHRHPALPLRKRQPWQAACPKTSCAPARADPPYAAITASTQQRSGSRPPTQTIPSPVGLAGGPEQRTTPAWRELRLQHRSAQKLRAGAGTVPSERASASPTGRYRAIPAVLRSGSMPASLQRATCKTAQPWPPAPTATARGMPGRRPPVPCLRATPQPGCGRPHRRRAWRPRPGAQHSGRCNRRR